MFKFVEKDGKYCLQKNGITLFQFAEDHGCTKLLNKKGKELLCVEANGDTTIGGTSLNNVQTIEDFDNVPTGLTFYLTKSLGGQVANKVYFKKDGYIDNAIQLN